MLEKVHSLSECSFPIKLLSSLQVKLQQPRVGFECRGLPLEALQGKPGAVRRPFKPAFAWEPQLGCWFVLPCFKNKSQMQHVYHVLLQSSVLSLLWIPLHLNTDRITIKQMRQLLILLIDSANEFPLSLWRECCAP